MEEEQFLLVFPSNSSMRHFPDNTTSSFITELPHSIVLHGQLEVAITEIQFPCTFLHIRHNKNVIRFVDIKPDERINFFSLYADGMQIPSRPLQSKDEPLYVEAYHTIFSGTDIHFLNEGNSISRDNYANGYTLFAFDLTPDLSANCAGHWNLVEHGSLRLEVRFEKALSVIIKCIVYAEFDNVLEIDSSRQVIVDYSG
ncbi:PREDICTED: uncharacterized protein F54H12.2-like [Trachymyrmex cornetzi]|uniref:uncharacterized protein F54H12.2-like n=1 Tax=Trachymyrmex cornetzi TaxID=471704 RepID=UPI00084F6199|nr:PREDICTED: uncharacterized protein F54H12.2-like [Trachymyrmex cornetzi]